MQVVIKVLATRTQVNYGTADASSFISVLTNGDSLTLDRMILDSKTIVTDYEDVNPLVLVLKVEDPNTASAMAITLLESGANINGPKDATTTPLIKAAEIQNIDFVRFFLNSRANVNAVDVEGKSALIYAVEKNNYEIVNILIRSYADKKYSYKDKEGKKKSYSVCNVVKDTHHTLENTNDLLINEKIRSRLNCSTFLWF
jgi:ankyrin repeat protein